MNTLNTKTIDLKTFTLYSASLFFLLISVYLFTYRGFPLSQDSYYIFDSAESLVRRGTFDLTYEFVDNFRVLANDNDPWTRSRQEPLNIVLVAPFYWLGSQLSGVGTVHVMWLFNVLMSAFVAVNLFWGALWLRYPVKVAWWGALIFGIGTLLWTYSRFMFREPITTFFVLWGTYSAIYVHRHWQTGHFPVKGLLVFVVSFVGLFLSKEVSVTLLPGLLLILLPPIKRIKWRVVIPALLVVAGLVILCIALILFFDQSSTRYSLGNWMRRLNIFNFPIFIESVLGYQISWSRSFWLHSPILLIGLLGIRPMVKRGEWRVVAGMWLMLLLLSGAYVAYFNSWWGNLGWGPRYMLPLVPVFMIGVLEVMTYHVRTTTHKILLGVVVLIGAGIQVVGMTVTLSNYYTDMFFLGVLPELNAQTQWGAYNWQWDYSPLKYHLTHFNLATFDIAWVYNKNSAVMVVMAGLIAVSVGYAGWMIRRDWQPRRRHLLSVIVMIGGIVGVMAGAMVSIRDDVRYVEEWPDVRELVAQLNHQVTVDQIVFVDRQQYQLTFMNYFKVPAIVAILPYAPGENYDGTIPDIDPLRVERVIGQPSYHALKWASQTSRQIWLIASSSPFEADKIRPVERYLTENFYPIEELATSDRARAIHYLMLNQRQTDDHQPLDVVFGERLQIQSVVLPLGQTFSGGDILAVTLDWSPIAELPDDYHLSVRLVAADGYVLTQHDGLPIRTFGRTSTWEQGEIYSDNHGIRIPQGAIAGDYTLQVIVYRWEDGERLPITSHPEWGDEAIITTITIQ